jgi:mRNA interferase RelE/StbE
MKYSITFTKSALKSLKFINKNDRIRIIAKIDLLKENPYPIDCKKLKTTNALRIRMGSYRVIYDIINEDLIVRIIKIGHRKDVYLN